MKTYPACKGKNCGCTDGVSHSVECKEEYEMSVDPDYYRGAWECPNCGYKGQENRMMDTFCSKCHHHR